LTDGRLAAVAGALREAGRRHGTPCYVTDVAAIERAAAELAAAFPDPWLRLYSVKANDVPAVIGAVMAAGVHGASVVSRGEWSLASQAGVPDDRVALEGIGLTDPDLRSAVRAAGDGRPPLWIALESPEEAATLRRLAERARLGSDGRPRLDVLLRFNPAVEPETRRGLAVGRGAAKFGMIASELSEAIDAGGGLHGPLRWRGIHLHVGSQLGAVDAWRDAVRRAMAVFALLRGYGSIDDFDTLDVGGGFPVSSTEPAAVPTPARFARELPPLVDAIPADRRPTRWVVEPGRFLVAQAGWLVGRVLHVRDRDPRQVVIDTGMTELIRPALYGARHPIGALTSLGHPVERWDGGAAGATWTRVEGPICESTDGLGDHDLPPLRRGDLVAIADAGAYAASMGMRYNGRPPVPQLLLARDGTLSRATAGRPPRRSSPRNTTRRAR
jgi:diaminopimelate decarboxylase